jgi:methionyl-tRNA synthetase
VFPSIASYLDTYALGDYLRDWFQLVQLGNKYVDITKPRVSAKENPAQAQQDLQVLLWLLKQIGLLSSPFLLE